MIPARSVRVPGHRKVQSNPVIYLDMIRERVGFWGFLCPEHGHTPNRSGSGAAKSTCVEALRNAYFACENTSAHPFVLCLR